MSRCRKVLPGLLATLSVAAVMLGAPARADASFSLDFASTPGSEIVFNPANPGPGLTGSFQFNPQGGNSFQITDGGSGGPGGGPDSLNALFGTVSGIYNIGAITTVGTNQSAPVTPGGPALSLHQFIIDDGMGFKLTADVAWVDIFTMGTIGGLNSGGTVNVINFSYSGNNNDLISLASNAGGISTISFQFVPAQTLTQLTTPGGDQATSFSGSLFAPQGGPTVTPAPAGLVLAVSGLPFLLVGRLLRRRKASGAEGTALAA